MNMFKRRDPAQLAKQLEEVKSAGQYNQNDGSEWTLTTDSAGNGSAIIRFLPPKTDDDFPFIKLVNHGFKGTGKKWYINNCTSTHGDYDNCPVCRYISENDLYNTDNALFGKLKRKTSYWTNILVIKDPSAPENEGKVFKYRFGQKIMDKIDAMIQVDVDLDEVPVDVFCPIEGANFSLKAKKVGGYANYEDSKFLKQSKIPNIDDEDYQQELLKSMHDLKALKTFEKFEDLDKEFKLVMGTGASNVAANSAAKEADRIADELDQFEADMDSFVESPKEEKQKEEKLSGDIDLENLIDDL